VAPLVAQVFEKKRVATDLRGIWLILNALLLWWSRRLAASSLGPLWKKPHPEVRLFLFPSISSGYQV
jgi:hypothetical protein